MGCATIAACPVSRSLCLAEDRALNFSLAAGPAGHGQRSQRAQRVFQDDTPLPAKHSSRFGSEQHRHAGRHRQAAHAPQPSQAAALPARTSSYRSSPAQSPIAAGTDGPHWPAGMAGAGPGWWAPPGQMSPLDAASTPHAAANGRQHGSNIAGADVQATLRQQQHEQAQQRRAAAAQLHDTVATAVAAAVAKAMPQRGSKDAQADSSRHRRDHDRQRSERSGDKQQSGRSGANDSKKSAGSSRSKSNATAQHKPAAASSKPGHAEGAASQPASDKRKQGDAAEKRNTHEHSARQDEHAQRTAAGKEPATTRSEHTPSKEAKARSRSHADKQAAAAPDSSDAHGNAAQPERSSAHASATSGASKRHSTDQQPSERGGSRRSKDDGSRGKRDGSESSKDKHSKSKQRSSDAEHAPVPAPSSAGEAGQHSAVPAVKAGKSTEDTAALPPASKQRRRADPQPDTITEQESVHEAGGAALRKAADHVNGELKAEQSPVSTPSTAKGPALVKQATPSSQPAQQQQQQQRLQQVQSSSDKTPSSSGLPRVRGRGSVQGSGAASVDTRSPLVNSYKATAAKQSAGSERSRPARTPVTASAHATPHAPAPAAADSDLSPQVLHAMQPPPASSAAPVLDALADAVPAIQEQDAQLPAALPAIASAEVTAASTERDGPMSHKDPAAPKLARPSELGGLQAQLQEIMSRKRQRDDGPLAQCDADVVVTGVSAAELVDIEKEAASPGPAAPAGTAHGHAAASGAAAVRSSAARASTGTAVRQGAGPTLTPETALHGAALQAMMARKKARTGTVQAAAAVGAAPEAAAGSMTDALLHAAEDAAASQQQGGAQRMGELVGEMQPQAAGALDAEQPLPAGQQGLPQKHSAAGAPKRNGTAAEAAPCLPFCQCAAAIRPLGSNCLHAAVHTTSPPQSALP